MLFRLLRGEEGAQAPPQKEDGRIERGDDHFYPRVLRPLPDISVMTSRAQAMIAAHGVRSTAMDENSGIPKERLVLQLEIQ
jgi:hypothetical protein